MGYVTADQLNTPRAVTDQSATLEWSWTSDPFGNGQPTGSLTYNLRFPGQYYDAETGHSYNYFRDYDPATGRFIESDPIGLNGGINTYTYASANPLEFSDSSGQDDGIVLPNLLDPAMWSAAASAAERTPTVTDPFIPIPGTDNYCPKDCSKLIAQIRDQVTVMREAYEDLMWDEHNLFAKANVQNPGGDLAGYGTWQGHLVRYDGLRVGLERMVAQAEAAGCPVPDEALIWLDMPTPLAPGA